MRDPDIHSLMNGPPAKIGCFDDIEEHVLDRYQVCVSSFTPAHLINFLHSIVSYYCASYQTRSHCALSTLPSPHFWKQTPALINAVQKTIDLCRSHSRQPSNLEDVLLPLAFLIKAGSNSRNTTQNSEFEFLERVRWTLEKITTDWEPLLTESLDSRYEGFIALLGGYIPEFSGTKRIQYTNELLKCMERIKSRRYSSAMRSCRENQEAFYTDLRNAFRSEFHETRDSYGLSILDRLNLNVRVNLFLSHYSRITWRIPLEIPENMGLPFYPYMAIIQSSVSGKSRLLRELGRTLPLVYANLGPHESKGYPLANKSLRRFLLFEHPPRTNGSEISWHQPVDSQRCEDYYKCLLLTTTTVFYLFFSDRYDGKKRIRLPTTEDLRKKVNDAGWKTVGICEPDASGSHGKERSGTNDLFWEIVIRVTRQLLKNRYDVILDSGRAASAGPAVSGKVVNCSQLVTNELRHIEKSLNDIGARVHSPKERASGSSQVFTSPRSTESHAHASSAIPWSTPSPENLAQCILRYMDLRMENRKETLADIAASLQRVETDMNSDNHVLYALFLALDESRCLTKCMVHNRRSVTLSESEQDAAISAFRCLRRVAHHMYDTTGVSIFLLFSDTTAKLANFTPQRALDPSARMLPDQQTEEPPGQVHGPFTELNTESVGVLLLDKTVFDFRERLVAFCRRWERPVLNSATESVSEQVTSLPFHVLQERTDAKVTVFSSTLLIPEGNTTSAEENGREARSEALQGETIFDSDNDYVYLGRPLWASSMTHNDKGATWKDMVIFAQGKLLGGRAELAKHGPLYTKQCLAVIACRVPLQFVEHCGIAPQLVAEHMAWCRAVSWDRESVYLDYINEPLVATAAAVLWEQDLEGMLRCLVARCGSYLSNKGDLGEVAACIILVNAVDNAYKKQGEDAKKYDARKMDDLPCNESQQPASNEVQENSSSPAKKHYADKLRLLPKGLSMHSTVNLREILESSFCLAVVNDYSLDSVVCIEEDTSSGGRGMAWISNTSASLGSGDALIFVPRILAEGDIRFKSIKRAYASVGCRDIPFLFEANVAILMQRQQRGVDILIPLRLHFPREGGQPSTAWSCVTVQVKNRQRFPHAASVAGKHLDPVLTGAVSCDVGKEACCDRCMLIQQHHFGLVLNVHDGLTPTGETRFGKIWTFLPHATKDSDRTGNPSFPPSSKRRKSFNGNKDDKHCFEATDNTSGPRSACLMINGVSRGSSTVPGSRLKPEILRQIESLVAQGTLFGMIQRKTKQRIDSVKEVVAATARDDDKNYRILVQASKSAKQLVLDEEQLFTRKR